jgi:hypothetical protein
MNKAKLLIMASVLMLTTKMVSASIIIDPLNTLTDYVSLGEFNTGGDFEGWRTSQLEIELVNVFGLAGGVNGDVNDPKVILSGISGIDLSTGLFDIVEIRFGRMGPMSRFDFFWGAGANTGFSAVRRLTPVSDSILEQFVFHTVQFDMSDIASWSGSLSSVRFDPFSGFADSSDFPTTREFAIDYVRVGSVEVSEPSILGVLGLGLLCLGFARRKRLAN